MWYGHWLFFFFFLRVYLLPSAYSDLHSFEGTHLKALAFAVTIPGILYSQPFPWLISFGHFEFPSVATCVESPSLSNQSKVTNHLFLHIYHFALIFVYLLVRCTALLSYHTCQTSGFPHIVTELFYSLLYPILQR